MDFGFAATRCPGMTEVVRMIIYFAYGANMNTVAMRHRCPGARAVGPAVLKGFRFFVGREGWGSVKPSPGDTVHGVLWQLTPRDLAALHAFELLHTGLYDIRRLPVLRDGRRVVALIYLLRRRTPGRARPGYVEMNRCRRAHLAPAGALHTLGRALVAVALHRRTSDRRRGNGKGIHMSDIRHIVVRGRVQGVGYRAFVEREALALGLEGWVRNCRDGTVEALFSGEGQVIDDMIEACRRGPYAARVDAIDQRPGSAADFRLRRPGEMFSVLPTA